MNLDVALNELSVATRAPDIATARCWVHGLHNVLSALEVDHHLAVPADLAARPLAPGYTFLGYVEDRQVDEAERMAVLVALTKGPFLEACLDAGSDDLRLDGAPCLGLAVAFTTDGIAASLPSDPARWDTHTVAVTRLHLGEGAALLEETVGVRHASAVAHLAHHASWLEDMRMSPKDALALWDKRAELYPELVFCAEVKRQLRALISRPDVTRQAHRKLAAVQRHLAATKGAVFDPAQLPFELKGEKSATMQRSPEARTILCPDGQHRTFELHFDLPEGHRAYLLHDAAGKKVLVGRVHVHPPNASDH